MAEPGHGAQVRIREGPEAAEDAHRHGHRARRADADAVGPIPPQRRENQALLRRGQPEGHRQNLAGPERRPAQAQARHEAHPHPKGPAHQPALLPAARLPCSAAILSDDATRIPNPRREQSAAASSIHQAATSQRSSSNSCPYQHACALSVSTHSAQLLQNIATPQASKCAAGTAKPQPAPRRNCSVNTCAPQCAVALSLQSKPRQLAFSTAIVVPFLQRIDGER
mmetsp:Transcript_36293/g.55479  ORF Transcript_36293/g.55479 Transcript_36293/m.55479 type:complete len:225 (+) Transcript_36293:230-904(+)